MDTQAAITNINWLSVIISPLAALFLGALWYSPVTFGKVWQKELKMTDEEFKTGNPLKIFGLTVILLFLGAFSLEMFIGSTATTSFGAFAGFMAGLFWVSTSIGIKCLFERKGIKLFLIDAGYFTLSYTLMGIILGAW